MKIYISQEILSQLREIVFATRKETGACLFGEKDGDDFRVTHIAGPGKQARQLAFHYQADHQHQEDVYNELLKAKPALLHIGEFHVHPQGMSELSCGDLHTIKKVLETYEEFVAGVILRGPRLPRVRWPMLGPGGSCLYQPGVDGIRIYAKNRKERNLNSLSNKSVMVVGVGSGGSAVAEDLGRAGVKELILVDPDEFTEENAKRHILTHSAIGQNKALAMAAHLALAAPQCMVYAQPHKFGEGRGDSNNGQFAKPDVIACCADSDLCCQLVNDYAVRENIPVVYGAVWGAAETTEVIIEYHII